MKKLLVSTLLVFNVLTSVAQQTLVEAQKVYSGTSDFEFNASWQYLSTDLYLVNMSTIDNLLNTAWNNDKGWKKEIQSIFITAKLNGSVFNGLTYPLYNFTVSDEKTGKIYTSDTYDGIPIINNMPLSGHNNSISSEITLEAITKNKANRIAEFVQKQLAVLMSIKSWSDAKNVFQQELMNLAKGQNKYVFNSTIHIYDDISSKRKIHSIGVYMFCPGGRSVHIDSESKNNLDKILSSGKIPAWSGIINNAEYPYMVVVNYKTMYNSELDTKGEITADVVSQRRQKIDEAYKNKEIFPEIYEQEKWLNGYLDKYASLYETACREYNYNKDYSVLLKSGGCYLDLNKMKETVYAGSLNNEVFEDCFKKHYEDIFNRAQRELGLNNNLKKIVDVVDFYFSHKDIEQLTVEEVQQGMKLLNDFDFCDADGQFAREMCAYKIKIKKASGETVEDENEDNGDSTEDNEDNSSDGDDGNTSDDDRSDDEEDDIFSRHYEKRKANKQ
ncbi:MAG: hypothetical protein II852_04605 [Bacteroidales bacterium]|nr:hypothetical protein [Bacteroidales bacterium]